MAGYNKSEFVYCSLANCQSFVLLLLDHAAACTSQFGDISVVILVRTSVYAS
jgi:hypothetical protein